MLGNDCDLSDFGVNLSGCDLKNPKRFRQKDETRGSVMVRGCISGSGHAPPSVISTYVLMNEMTKKVLFQTNEAN